MATGKRKAYDPAFKVRVVEFAEANTQAAAARKFGVAEKQVREWKKKKEALLAARGGPSGAGGKRSGCLELEENCLAKIYRETSFQFLT